MSETSIALIKSEVGKTLVEKISNATGWVFTHDTPKRHAVNNYIKEIEESDLDPLDKAARISNAKKIIKEYSNQNKIVEIACNSINETAKPKEISDDWISLLMDRARLVSNEDFQFIWGKILSQECEEPNSVPKELIHIMSIIDKADAVTFLQLRKISAYIDDGIREYFPLYFREEEFYKSIEISFDSLINLEAIGLIKHSSSFDSFSFDSREKPLVLHYFDEKYTFPEEVKKIPCGNVIYTKAGDALCKAISTEPIEGFFTNVALNRINNELSNSVLNK